MFCYIYPIDPSNRPDQGLPGAPPTVGGGPVYPPGIWPNPPGWSRPNPPSIWNPTFPYLPIVIPPTLPPGINIPNFPTNPIVIPPLPPFAIPEGKALVLVVTSEGSKWGMVDTNAVVKPPIYGTEPTPK